MSSVLSTGPSATSTMRVDDSPPGPLSTPVTHGSRDGIPFPSRAPNQNLGHDVFLYKAPLRSESYLRMFLQTLHFQDMLRFASTNLLHELWQHT